MGADPTTWGWITVANYCVAIGLCVRALLRDEQSAFFWLATAGGLTLLAMNKQLDLQTTVTELARDYARAHGWYQERRDLQRAFVLQLGVLSAGAVAVLIVTLRGQGLAVLTACSGVAMLVAFIVLRAASFHHMDQMLASRVFGVKWHQVLENSGIIIVALAAALSRRRKAKGAASGAITDDLNGRSSAPAGGVDDGTASFPRRDDHPRIRPRPRSRHW